MSIKLNASAGCIAAMGHVTGLNFPNENFNSRMNCMALRFNALYLAQEASVVKKIDSQLLQALKAAFPTHGNNHFWLAAYMRDQGIVTKLKADEIVVLEEHIARDHIRSRSTRMSAVEQLQPETLEWFKSLLEGEQANHDAKNWAKAAWERAVRFAQDARECDTGRSMSFDAALAEFEPGSDMHVLSAFTDEDWTELKTHLESTCTWRLPPRLEEVSEGVYSVQHNPLNKYRTEIDPQPADLGGGWRLRLIENGKEVGGGVFPLTAYEGAASPEDASTLAYEDAQGEAAAWLSSRS